MSTPVIAMTILEPAHRTAVLGRSSGVRVPVTFRCEFDAQHTADSALQVRWWSSLPADPGAPPDPGDEGDVDLTKVAFGTIRDFSRAMWIGSQSITVSATNVAVNRPADLANATAVGMSGGAPPEAAHPCVIHVLVAEPVLLPGSVSGSNVVLKRSEGLWAEAPAFWGDPTYQALNGLSYRWCFSPQTGPVVFVEPPTSALEFKPRSDPLPPRVGVAAIPTTVPSAQHQLTLQVGYRATPTQVSFNLVAEATLTVTVQD